MLMMAIPDKEISVLFTKWHQSLRFNRWRRKQDWCSGL